jgi:hypothetical protein
MRRMWRNTPKWICLKSPNVVDCRHNAGGPGAAVRDTLSGLSRDRRRGSGACAGNANPQGTGADQPLPVRPASPAASISRTSTRPISRELRSIRRIRAAWPTPTSSIGLAWSRGRRKLSGSRCASPRPCSAGGNRKRPTYERCVKGAPLNSEETGPDISRADLCSA